MNTIPTSMSLGLSVSLTVAALSLGSVAQAATITSIKSRAEFDRFFANSVLEDWDQWPSGTVIQDGSTVNGITYFFEQPDSDPPLDGVVTDTFLPSSARNTLGLNVKSEDPMSNFFGPRDAVTFVFDRPLLAFGIDISTVSQGPDYSAFITFESAKSTHPVRVFSTFDPFPSRQFGAFIGFSSDTPFRSVEIRGTPTSNEQQFGYTLDTLRGVAVPSPALLPGLLGMGIAAWRKGRQGLSEDESGTGELKNPPEP